MGFKKPHAHIICNHDDVEETRSLLEFCILYTKHKYSDSSTYNLLIKLGIIWAGWDVQPVIYGLRVLVQLEE